MMRRLPPSLLFALSTTFAALLCGCVGPWRPPPTASPPPTSVDGQHLRPPTQPSGRGTGLDPTSRQIERNLGW